MKCLVKIRSQLQKSRIKKYFSIKLVQLFIVWISKYFICPCRHGKAFFSSKGIKLAVDYFLNRGHTEITVFVPKFRKFHNPKSNFPTKDPEILENLYKKQYVVYTPSRRVSGKCIQSYDDRWVITFKYVSAGNLKKIEIWI